MVSHGQQGFREIRNRSASVCTLSTIALAISEETFSCWRCVLRENSKSRDYFILFTGCCLILVARLEKIPVMDAIESERFWEDKHFCEETGQREQIIHLLQRPGLPARNQYGAEFRLETPCG